MEQEPNTNTNNQSTAVAVVIPDEVTQLVNQLPEQKQNGIITTLSQLFQGTSDLNQKVSSIVVKDHNDLVGMKIADTVRKSVKDARLHVADVVKTKRQTVQMEKLSYDIEDKIWLKVGQIADIVFKPIEQQAAYKADTLKRYEIEQYEIKVMNRLTAVQVFNPNVTRFEIEAMSDEMFDIFLDGVEKKYNERIEAERIEAEKIAEKERIEKLHLERKDKALPYYQYWSEFEKTLNFGEQSELDFTAFIHRLEKCKKDADDAVEAQRLENLRLQQVAKEKEELREARLQLIKGIAIYGDFTGDLAQYSNEEFQKMVDTAMLNKKNAEDKAAELDALHNKRIGQLEGLLKYAEITAELTSYSEEEFEKILASAKSEKAKQEKADKEKQRLDKLFSIGLKYNGESVHYKDINFHWTDIICMKDEEFEKAFVGASERMKAIRKEELHEERKTMMLPYWDFIPVEFKNEDFSSITEEEWNDRFEWTKSQFEKAKEKESDTDRILKWIDSFEIPESPLCVETIPVKHIKSLFDNFKANSKSYIQRLEQNLKGGEAFFNDSDTEIIVQK